MPRNALILIASVLAACGGAPPETSAPAGPEAAAEDVHRYDIAAETRRLAMTGAPETVYQGTYVFDDERDWFSPNVPVWREAFSELAGQPDLQYLEIGCYEGRSAVWMLENVLTDPTSRLTCIDPYEAHIGEEVKQRFLENVARAAGDPERVKLIQGYSQVEMRKLPLDRFHIIYIDGDHRAGPVLEDAVTAWRLLRQGGLMAFDDYDWELQRPLPDRPQMGVDFFVEAFRGRLEVVHRDYQLIVRKTAS